MGATELALLSAGNNHSAALNSFQRAWWLRFAARCAGSNCPKEGKFWPYWLHKSAGMEFDGRWYCGPGCMEAVLAGRIHTLLAAFHLEKPRVHRLPIGLLLLNRGAISQAQLREAIRLQRESGGGRLGDWLRQTAELSAQQLTAALGQQWGCPVFPLEHQAASAPWSDLIPLPLLASAAAVPAHVSPDGSALHLAFGERVDHTLLYAVEQILGCRTFPCVASPAAVQAHLEHFRKLTSGNSTTFDTVRESSEMIWTICNYATELKATRLVVARAAAFIWVRFFRGKSAKDLLFRLLPGNHPCIFERSSAAPKALPTPADGRKGGVSDALTPL